MPVNNYTFNKFKTLCYEIIIIYGYEYENLADLIC